MAITAVHSLIYSDDPPATRAFLRDVLGLPFVGMAEGSDSARTDTSDEQAWLIFGTGPSELGVHPTSEEWQGESIERPRQHQITLMCDDLADTVAALEAKGATFTSEPDDEGYGVTITLAVPGADDILLYEPRHPTAYDLA